MEQLCGLSLRTAASALPEMETGDLITGNVNRLTD